MHPMAAAMNAIGYDAAALGNHEFNYGVPTCCAPSSRSAPPAARRQRRRLEHRRSRLFPPYVIKTVTTSRAATGHVTRSASSAWSRPGVAIWDKANVEGKIKFHGIVEQAKIVSRGSRRRRRRRRRRPATPAPPPRRPTATRCPSPRTPAALLAEQVPDIDAILVGHAHVEIPAAIVTNTSDRQAGAARRAALLGHAGRRDGPRPGQGHGRWQVATTPPSHGLNANTVPRTPRSPRSSGRAHEKVLAYVNGVIGTSTAAMSRGDLPLRGHRGDGLHQLRPGRRGQEGAGRHADATLPMLSIAAPFNRPRRSRPATSRCATWPGSTSTTTPCSASSSPAPRCKAYLEFSAQYFKQVASAGPFAADAVTNAVTRTAPNGTPDYNYDIMGGLDAPLTYDIDIAQPVGSAGSRTCRTRAPRSTADQAFVIAINNYRQSGGGNFPGVTTAPVVYNAQVEIRQLLIDWVTANKVIDPSVFSTLDWKLVANGQPVTITG